MEEKIKALEKRVAELEKHVQEQPTLKEILRSVVAELKKSLETVTPEVSAQEQLNKKDLYCIARHIQLHTVKKVYHNESDIQDPCEVCKFSKECLNSFNGSFNPWETFKKLSQITGVKISEFKGFKI